MEDLNNTPLYNLSVVLRETGLKADTLRAWERRFGVPNPARTEGGHRQYSEKDIATVQWLLARQQEGMRISKAVQLLNHLREQGQHPIKDSASPSTAVQPLVNLSQMNQLDDLRDAWVEACLQFDENRAEQILTQAFALYSVEIACIELLQNGLAQIGAMWYDGSSSVQQEHFASALALRRVHSLIAATAPPIRNEDVIVACPPHEDHTFAPLLLTLMLRRRGLSVHFLGANVPLDQLIDTIVQIKANLTVFSAQQLSTAATLFDVSSDLAKHGVMIAYGGRIFNLLPQIQEVIPGHFLGSDFSDAINSIEALLRQPQTNPNGVTPSPEYGRTHRLFEQKRAAITAEVFAQLPDGVIEPVIVQLACENLASNIAAALRLGDMKLLGDEISWVTGMLQNRASNDTHLRMFLELFARAAAHQLGPDGRIVNAWFEKLLK
jgi:DNA-binding transcriptional MerR regulator